MSTNEQITFDGTIYFETVNFDIASVNLEQYEIEDEDLLRLLYYAYDNLSAKKIREFVKYCKLLQWGRKNPVDFGTYILGINLLDLQKYALINSWDKQFVLWLKCRNAGKSTLIAIYIILRSMLIPYHVTYILGKTGDQAKETFKKLEKIVLHKLPEFRDINDVFENELQRNTTNHDGFKHDPTSFTIKLFNESEVYTLNSDPTNIKGKRANLVVFDEAGWFSDELFTQAEAFVNQNENFSLSEFEDPAAEARGFPRQLLYASSASDTSSKFYGKFKNITERMLIGDSKYFAVNYDADMLLTAKFNGEEHVPLVSKEVIEKAMTEDRERGLREYYNKFSADTFDGQIISRRDIMQCTDNYVPLLTNDTGVRQIVMSWDSARLNDNSVIVISEFYKDTERGWMMRVLNVVSLVDVRTKNRTPMRFPEQVDKFKELLLEYNGTHSGKLDYENIKQIICDAGAGGQMIGGVTDYMLSNWTDANGYSHKGLIDKSHKANQAAISAYPDAVDIMTLVDPRAHRNEIFEAIEKMVKLGVVWFPADTEGRDYLTFIEDDGTEIIQNLNADEMMASAQIELMKTEIVTMCKFVTQGNVKYDFPPEKRNRMHDDRVFAFGLSCWYLAKLRRGDIVRKKPEPLDPAKLRLPFRAPAIRRV